jgi:predicted ATPase
MPTEGFPFSLPAIRSFERLSLDAPVTFLVGENGSGKSTLLEALAYAAELWAVGADRIEMDPSLEPQRELGRHLRLAWSVRSRSGFFLRAEDFFGHLKTGARITARILREKGLVRLAEPSPDARHDDEVLAERHLKHVDVRSHGESFLEFFQRSMQGEGLYLLDEPEAPLSPKRQLAFLALMHECVKEGAQLVVATHSPILLSYPGARIVSFDHTPMTEVAYESLEHFRVTRDFLNDREKYLKPLLDP